MLSVSNMHFLSSVTMVNVIMLIVVMLSVMAPSGILANPGHVLYKNIVAFLSKIEKVLPKMV
jgi:hypothetical protein